MEKVLTWDEFYTAYTDFYWDGYHDLIEEWYEKYKDWTRYTNKNMFIQEYLNN